MAAMFNGLRSFLLGGVAMGSVAVKLQNAGDFEPSIMPSSARKTFDVVNAQRHAADSIQRYMTVNGIPGVSAGVSIDGEVVWRQGFGYACVETSAPCTKDTIMCIASISKSVTAMLAARLVDAGSLDLDRSIYDYLEPDDFPRKMVNGESVDITTRQLLSHTGGIRHYPKKDCINNEIKEKLNKKLSTALTILDSKENEQPLENVNEATKSWQSELLNILKYKPCNEFHLNSEFESIWDALELFKYDELVAQPGDRFYYTTHGFTLAAAVIERAYNKNVNKNRHSESERGNLNNKKKSNKKEKKNKDKSFQQLLTELFTQLGMRHTFADDPTQIVPNRARYYQRNPTTHKLENTPQVNNSYKFAGGGLLSDVTDLLTFANALLYSYQNNESCTPKPFIRRKTAEQLWSITSENTRNYGLGWIKGFESMAPIGGISQEKNSEYWYHTGAAIGASSVLLSKPAAPNTALIEDGESRPRGICVAILANCYGINDMATLARDIVDAFESEYRKRAVVA